MHPGPPRRRRARPVADAPINPLLERAEDLAKGWLLTLLEQVPLDDAPAILAADLARDGPRVCTAVVRALADDDDLRRIEKGGALELLVARTGEFAGAIGPEATSRAVDALSAVIWSAVRSVLSDPEPEQVYELAERLALAIEAVRSAALRNAEVSEPVPDRGGGAHRVPPVPPRRLSSVGPSAAASASTSATSTRPAAPTPAPDAVLPAPDAVSSAPDAVSPAPDAVSPAPDAVSPAPERPQSPAASEPLWMGALDDEIKRSERSGTPLSLLLVELDDAERIAAAEPPREASATFGRFAQAVRSVVRRGDILACESETRAWIIARDTGRAGARSLAERAVSAVRATRAWRGAPLGVSVGIAVLGEDANDSETLSDAAEEAKWAAAAAGTGVDAPPPPEPNGNSQT